MKQERKRIQGCNVGDVRECPFIKNLLYHRIYVHTNFSDKTRAKMIISTQYINHCLLLSCGNSLSFDHDVYLFSQQYTLLLRILLLHHLVVIHHPP